MITLESKVAELCLLADKMFAAETTKAFTDMAYEISIQMLACWTPEPHAEKKRNEIVLWRDDLIYPMDYKFVQKDKLNIKRLIKSSHNFILFLLANSLLVSRGHLDNIAALQQLRKAKQNNLQPAQ